MRNTILKIFSSQTRPQNSPPLPSSTAPLATQSAASTPNSTGCSPAISTSIIPRRNLALELAIQRHVEKLLGAEREAFLTAAKDIDEHKLLIKVRNYDEQHASSSSFRLRAERVSKFLRLLDRFMGGVTTGIQANPDLSAIIVGGVRVVIDLAIDFVEFFSRVTDMLCKFEDYLPTLAALADACQDSSLIEEAVAGAYTDILDFCRKARAVFILAAVVDAV